MAVARGFRVLHSASMACIGGVAKEESFPHPSSQRPSTQAFSATAGSSTAICSTIRSASLVEDFVRPRAMLDEVRGQVRPPSELLDLRRLHGRAKIDVLILDWRLTTPATLTNRRRCHRVGANRSRNPSAWPTTTRVDRLVDFILLVLAKAIRRCTLCLMFN
jgi:hypothetical protein